MRTCIFAGSVRIKAIFGGGVVAEEDKFSCEDAAEVMRKKEKYRRLIFSGKLVLPYRRAAELLGPDCLYHLYSLHESEASQVKNRRASRHRRRSGAKPGA